MIENNFFDDLETRSADERNNDHLEKLNNLVEIARENKNQSSEYEFSGGDNSKLYKNLKIKPKYSIYNVVDKLIKIGL